MVLNWNEMNYRECSDLGGTATSQCANGFGVCCIFQVRCGGRTGRNGTYFVDTGVTFAENQVQTCNVQIIKTTPLIKQIRLDFQIFSVCSPGFYEQIEILNGFVEALTVQSFAANT
ncbi:unnamed protein product [Allacma fusca]|uniref:Uncharacterized protein n=1 Tax=Allacma fusca TaxID=39272 RepID=A0A8J2L361_9HEXA|nr:unnamed protein product [Allacma fusca]